MYIRKTKTKTLEDGEAYFTYRLVESVGEGQQVKQRALLNLGADFAIEPQHWPLLTARIEQLLQDADSQQVELFALADELGVVLETAAQRVSRLLVHKLAQTVEPSAADYQREDINRVDAFESRISALKPLLTMIPVPTGLNQLCAYSLYQSKAHSLHPLYLMALKQCLIELIVGIYIKVEYCLCCILIKEIAILCVCEFAYYQNIYNYDLPVNGD